MSTWYINFCQHFNANFFPRRWTLISIAYWQNATNVWLYIWENDIKCKTFAIISESRRSCYIYIRMALVYFGWLHYVPYWINLSCSIIAGISYVRKEKKFYILSVEGNKIYNMFSRNIFITVWHIHRSDKY